MIVSFPDFSLSVNSIYSFLSGRVLSSWFSRHSKKFSIWAGFFRFSLAYLRASRPSHAIAAIAPHRRRAIAVILSHWMAVISLIVLIDSLLVIEIKLMSAIRIGSFEPTPVPIPIIPYFSLAMLADAEAF